MPYVCPTCTPRGSDKDTYASVLVLGVGQLGTTLEEIKRVSTSNSVANISSYCIRCMCITPCLNTAVCMPENLMEWKRKYAFYTSCEAFINEWPKKKHVKRLRKLNREEDTVEDMTVHPDTPADEET